MDEPKEQERKPYTVRLTDKEARTICGMTLAREVGSAVEIVVRTAMHGRRNHVTEGVA